MRDEVKLTYTDEDGNEFEAFRVGEHFAVREAPELAGRDYLVDGVKFRCTHCVVYLPTCGTISCPNEELAWFFADQLAIHADDMSPDKLDEFMQETGDWASHVLLNEEKTPYHHWVREHGS